MSENCDTTPDSSGGLGGLPAGQWTASAADVRLIRRAIREGWPVDPAISKQVLDAVIVDGLKSKRSRRTALRTAMLMLTIDRKAIEEDHGRPDPLGRVRDELKDKTPLTLSDVLRKRIVESGLRLNALATLASVQRKSLDRFVHGRGGIQVAAADRLADVLGLELRAKVLGDGAGAVFDH